MAVRRLFPVLAPGGAGERRSSQRIAAWPCSPGAGTPQQPPPAHVRPGTEPAEPAHRDPSRVDESRPSEPVTWLSCEGRAPTETHPQDMTAPVLPSPCRILLAAGVACVLAAAPASADVPSLDAYAGQALVLGGPHHPHAGGHSGGSNAPGSSGGGGGSGSAVGSGPSAGTGSSPGSGSSAGPTQANSGTSRSRAGAASPAGTGWPAGKTGSPQRSPATAQLTGSSVPLSGLDVLLLVVGFVCLVSVGVVLRHARRTG